MGNMTKHDIMRVYVLVMTAPTSLEASSCRVPPPMPVAHEDPMYQSFWRIVGKYGSFLLGLPTSRAIAMMRLKLSVGWIVLSF